MRQSRTSLRVLIAEDNFLVAGMLCDWLSDEGHVAVGPAGTISAALACIESGDVDLALLDVDLRGRLVTPVMEALDARGIPYVLITAYRDQEVRSLCERCSDAPTLSKPFDRAALFQALGRVAATA